MRKKKKERKSNGDEEDAVHRWSS